MYRNKSIIRVKYLFLFVIVFIFLTPIGTILHELGHIVVAKHLGYNTSLHYSSMSWNNTFKSDVMDRYSEYKFEIENKLPFRNRIQYDIDASKMNKDYLMILLGGVIQTISFGTFGFVFLFIRRKSSYFGLKEWISVFITFFWSREIFNLIIGCIRGLISNSTYYYGDEVKIANLLNFPEGSILLPLGIISSVLIIITIKIIPNKLRYTFILSGLIGSPVGFYLWMYLLGPIVLP